MDFFSRSSIISLLAVLVMTIAGISQDPCQSGKSLLYESDFNKFDRANWILYPHSNWEISNTESIPSLCLLKSGFPRKIRSPRAFAIIKDIQVSDMIFQGELKSLQKTEIRNRDMIVVFGYRDSSHFYYAHYSGKSDDKHNIIAIVNGKDREKINMEEPGNTEPKLLDQNYHHFKVSYESESGKIMAYLDDMNTPIMKAIDTTFRNGCVGIGSFDDFGCVRNLKLWRNLNE
jgi:hypothetical protein